jgi:hypothetical protein
MSKQKPYAEIRDWVNMSQTPLIINRKAVKPGGSFKGEAPRFLIRTGALRPKVKVKGTK